MTRKKMTNAILDANGGLDSVRALSTAHNILLNHDLQRPILYHVVITGGDIETYQAVIKKLIRRIRTKCRAEYFGAYEVAENRGGAHAHVFILIETRHNQPFKFMDIREGGYLLKLAKAHKLQKPDGTISPIHISKPKNRMHGGQMFAVPVGDELVADCLKWATYEYKSRSKEGVKRREVYFNSEFASNVAKRAVAKAQRTSRKAKPAPIPAVVTVPVALPAPLPLVDSGKVAVPHPDGVVTMSSVEIVEAINAMRSPRMGKLDHDSFMPKVKEVLGFASTAFLGFCQDSNGSTVKCYHLPKRESTLMMMADSLEVQTQVYDRLAALEEQAAATRRPQKYGEALLALAEKVQKEEALQLEHASASNPPALPVDYRAGPTTNEGDAVTPAEQYVASKYEAGVDQQLDIDALRLFLLEHGIKRTPAQVAWELEEKYGFLGYASRYPAPAKPDTRMLDALIDRTPLKSAKGTHLSHGQDRMIVSGKARKIYQTHC